MAKAQLAAGMTIDGFLLEQRLHRGGMAAIWRVSHPDIDFPIVMKVPFLDYDGDLSLLVGFEVEQMIMAELTGTHVPRFVANGDFTVQPHIVMEYVAPSTLLQRMADPPFPLDEVIERAIAMADALGDLHQQHVLHLDLKPANILFRDSGEAVLIDFGLSRHEHLPDLLDEQYHRPTGTTEYMAPEQLLRVRSDKRSDIYALGAIIYQMATGELPFGAPGRIKHVRQRVWRDPVPPRKLKPEISPGLQEVILKCLEPLPDRRYTTAEELSFDLRNLDLVELTERAARLERADFKTTFGRWMRVRGTMQAIAAAATKPAPRAPIILVAVDLRPGLDQLRQALLDAAVSVLANMPGATARLSQRHADLAHRHRRERGQGRRQHPRAADRRTEGVGRAIAAAARQDHLSPDRIAQHRRRRPRLRALEQGRSPRRRCADQRRGGRQQAHHADHVRSALHGDRGAVERRRTGRRRRRIICPARSTLTRHVNQTVNANSRNGEPFRLFSLSIEFRRQPIEPPADVRDQSLKMSRLCVSGTNSKPITAVPSATTIGYQRP